MAKYALLVDGEETARVATREEAARWLLNYRAEHAEDDPDAVHVLVREVTRFAWLTGGRLIDREEFFDKEGLHAIDG